MELWGVDWPELSLRLLHGLMAAAWLLFDFLVYWLHFDVKNPAVPLARRLERAHIMHRIDQVVGVVFLLMLPTGIALSLMTGTALFEPGWLSWKHLIYALIMVDALILLPISGAAIGHLEALGRGEGDADDHNTQIRHSMNKAMPAVFLVWFLVALASLLSFLNLKAPPEHQELMFRKTAIEQPAGDR